MSMAPPPATTVEFFIARRTIMMASCSERSASSRNCSQNFGFGLVSRF